jgi:hypothetical protein
MPVDPSEVLDLGGKGLIDLLQFALVSARPELVFAFLVREYRTRPTAAGAVALYDQFCAPHAPARVRADDALPPRDPALPAALAPVRAAVERAAAFRPTADVADPPPVPIPPKYLFDRAAALVLADPDGPAAACGREFDPDLGPLGSLPGGRRTPGQRVWSETNWCKLARPALVAAGFWRVAALGQP